MKAATPPLFCAWAMTWRRERRLARGLRAEDLDDAAAREAADAERRVDGERAGRDDRDRRLRAARRGA